MPSLLSFLFFPYTIFACVLFSWVLTHFGGEGVEGRCCCGGILIPKTFMNVFVIFSARKREEENTLEIFSLFSSSLSLCCLWSVEI